MKDTQSRGITYGFLLITAILFCWWYWVTPYYNDDYVFSIAPENWLDGVPWKGYLGSCGTKPFDWELWRDCMRRLIERDSPRFGNFLLAPWLLWLPKWVFNIITTIIFILSIIISARAINVKISRFNRIALLTLFLLMFLPWEGGMTCIIFGVNYVWPLILASIYLYLYLHPKDKSLLLLFTIGVVTGWSHECLALPLFSGSLITILFAKKERRQRIIMAIGVLLPAIIMLLIESVGRQINQPIPLFQGFIIRSFNELIYKFIVGASCLWLAIASLFFLLLKKGWRGIINATSLFLWAASIVSFIIGLCLAYLGDRTQWYTQYFSILLTFWSWNLLVPKSFFHNRLRGIPIVGVTICLVINFYYGISLTIKLAREQLKIEEEYLIPCPTNFYYEMSAINSPSILAFNRLSYYNQVEHTDTWYWKAQCAYAGVDYKLTRRPIPLELKNINFENITKITGNNPFYSCQGYIIAPIGFYGHKCVVQYSTGSRREKSLVVTPLLENGAGNWMYVQFMHPDWYTRWGKINKVDIW